MRRSLCAARGQYILNNSSPAPIKRRGSPATPLNKTHCWLICHAIGLHCRLTSDKKQVNSNQVDIWQSIWKFLMKNYRQNYTIHIQLRALFCWRKSKVLYARSQPVTGSILEESIENFELAQKHISEEGLLHYYARLRISLKFEQELTGNRTPQTAWGTHL
jgi:hypothetical protein